MDERSPSDVVIPYGLRRYWLLVVMFVSMGIGLSWFGSTISRPTFVFPLGVLPPDLARPIVMGVGALALVYVAVVTWVKVGVRPAIVLASDHVVLPQGELGRRTIVLRKSDVLAVHDEATRGGWRRLTVSHRGGVATVQSAQLPDDRAYARVRERLSAWASRRG